MHHNTLIIHSMRSIVLYNNNIENNTYVLTNTNSYYHLFELGSESESSFSLSESDLSCVFLGTHFLLYGFPLAGPFPRPLLATDLSSRPLDFNLHFLILVLSCEPKLDSILYLFTLLVISSSLSLESLPDSI